MTNKTETVLITGASSGIGEALAWEFASHGHNLILVARSADTLGTLAHALIDKHQVGVTLQPSDLSRPGSAQALYEATTKAGLAVDILVNSAGVIEHGAFCNIKPEDHQRIVQLNIAGLTDILAHFIPPMVARKSGRIMNVSSITAFQPVPSLATYAASKAFVLSLSEALAEELCEAGISVTALCPGFTATRMLTGVGKVSEQVPSLLIGEVDEVARQGFAGCMNGNAIVVPGNLNRIATALTNITPRWLIRRIAGKVGRSTLICSR